MTKIYLLLFFYLLKIDFCGMEDEKDNNNIINENDIIGKLCSYKDKKIPNQIQKPKYDREIGDLFKIEDFKFRKKNEQNENNNIINENAFDNQENEEGINNDVNNIWGEIEAENANILQNIRDKEGIFDRINIADDYNEGNIVECCCFVSRESVYRVKETSRKYFDENQYLKRSGKDIVDLNKDYRNTLNNKYKKLLKKEKEKEEVISQREYYEEKLKNQIKDINEKYHSLLNYDEELANNFETYNNDYSVIEKYYAEGERLANDSINEIKKLISSIKQKESKIKDLKNDINVKEEKYKGDIKVIEEKYKTLECNKTILETKFNNLTSEKDTIVKDNRKNIEILNSQINELNINEVNNKNTIANIQNENSKLKIKIRDLENNIAEKKEENNRNIKTIEEKNRTINNLKNEKVTLQKDNENLLKEKDSKINNLNSKINELNLNIIESENEKKLQDEKNKNDIEKINVEKNRLENNFKKQIEKLNDTINELKTSKEVCEVEKGSIKNEKERLKMDIIYKNKDIENLQKENEKLREKYLELSTKYNQNIEEINKKNNNFLQLYVKEVHNNNARYNELYQAIAKFNLDWDNSLDVFYKVNNAKFENIIKLNENFNLEKQKKFETTINDFIEGQKKMIENINELNNKKLKEISNYYKTTVKDFEKKYNETLDKIGKQAKNYEKAVNGIETTLKKDSANNSIGIISIISNLTNTISGSLKKTYEELNEQKNQFSNGVNNLENNIKKVIGENVDKINNEMTSLNNGAINNIKINIGDLNRGNIDNLNTLIENLKIEAKKINEDRMGRDKGLMGSLNTLNENIEKWSKEKEKLETKIKELENENKSLNEKNSDLNLMLNKHAQKIDSLNKGKENLNINYNKLQEKIKEIGKELKVEEEGNEKEQEDTRFALHTSRIKDKIKELQKKIDNDEIKYKNLKEINKRLKDKNSELNKENYNAINDKLKVALQFSDKRIEILNMLYDNIKKQKVENKNENEINGQENIEKIKEEIENLKKDINEKFKNAIQVAYCKKQIKELEKKAEEQEEQLKAAALGLDLKEQQEFDNYANKMRQDNIRRILNDATLGYKMIQNRDNKNENEILKEEYYLPFIFEDYNINNKWIYLKKWNFSITQEKKDKENIALKSNEIVYDENLKYESFNNVLFENLGNLGEFMRVNLQEIASKKVKEDIKTEDGKSHEEIKDVEKKKVESYKNYNIYIRGKDKNKILLGNYFCEEAVNILKNFPNADLYLLFIGTNCFFYLKEIPLQKFMEYCAFVQGCTLYTRIGCYGEYLPMHINAIVTGSAAIERNNFKYFTKEDLQSIFSSLFSNRWFKCKDLTQTKKEGDFIPKDILSYPELLMKPLNKNEYAASKIIDKGLQHPYIEKKIETKVMEYEGNTVFWYKCDMQDPVTYLLSECIGLGNYGYIGRFYKRDGQGNYYPVALKLTLDSATHKGGSHEAIMKEIKAGKAAAVMGCDRMIYSNRAGLIELKNSNFIDEIDKNKFSNMFLDPLEFIKKKNKMNSENKDYKQLLLTKSDSEDASDIYCRKDKKMNIEKWDKETFKKAADYDYRINFLEKRFKDFYNSEKFKKFHNLMFNNDNKVQNALLYVMEMDIIDEKDEDLYTETTTEKIKNNEEKEKKEEEIAQENEINEEDKKIDINDDIKHTINNIAEYLTAQYKCGVIHGDIKAKNMTKNKFLDFGSFDMVINYETNTEFSDVVGTPEYWDLVRIFNKQLELVAPYDVLLKDYQLSDLYASIVALYYYMFKEYPAFATLIIIIKSILKHYINDVGKNNDYCNEKYEKTIEDFIGSFPTGKELVECTKAFEKEKKLKKQINKGMKDGNIPKEENKEEKKEEEKEEKEGEEEKKEKENLNKFNKYLKEVEDKNYLSNEVKQLRYCIYQIIQKSLLTITDVKEKDVDKDKLFFIMSKQKKFYSKGEIGWSEVNEFSPKVVEKLIEIYKNLREKELENIEKLTKSEDEKKNMLGRIMYQILQQGTFANSEKYPAFDVFKNEHSYNNKAEGNEDFRRKDLNYRTAKVELIKKIRNKDTQENIKKFLEDYNGFGEDYEARLALRKNSYLYTLEPLSIKSLITQQPYYQYEKSFINIINEKEKENEENK